MRRVGVRGLYEKGGCPGTIREGWVSGDYTRRVGVQGLYEKGGCPPGFMVELETGFVAQAQTS